MRLEDLRYLTPYQVESFYRVSTIRRRRDTLDNILQQHAKQEILQRIVQEANSDLKALTYVPVALPEKAQAEMEEYERKRREGTRNIDKLNRYTNGQPRRERFSIFKKKKETPPIQHRSL